MVILLSIVIFSHESAIYLETKARSDRCVVLSSPSSFRFFFSFLTCSLSLSLSLSLSFLLLLSSPPLHTLPLSHTHKGMERLIDQFHAIVREFRLKRHDLLDYHNNKFDRDYVEFNVKVRDVLINFCGHIVFRWSLEGINRSIFNSYLEDIFNILYGVIVFKFDVASKRMSCCDAIYLTAMQFYKLLYLIFVHEYILSYLFTTTFP